MTTKIVHVTHSMEIGGTEQVIMQLVRGLDATRFTNVITCIDGDVGDMGIELQHEGFTIHALRRNEGFDKALIGSLRKILKSEKADIVHCHQYTPYCYGVLAAVGLPTKVVFTEHGRFYPDSYSWKRRLINQLLVRATDSIVSISEATKQALIKYEWMPGRQIKVIYNGLKYSGENLATNTVVDLLNEEKPGFASDTDTLVGTVARLDPIKNHAMMIRAIDRLKDKHPGCRLVIVGDGPERESSEQLVKQHGLDKHVLFTGFKHNTSDYISSFDIFLLTSDSEGTSMTLLEAMACSTPCVVTNVGGNPELIEHKHNGLLVERNNDQELIDAVDQLLSDEGLSSTLASQAHRDFNSRFELQHMINGYGELYLTLLPDAR